MTSKAQARVTYLELKSAVTETSISFMLIIEHVSRHEKLRGEKNTLINFK